MRRDMGHMERENYKLRQQVELARGLQQHEPYLRLTGELPGADDGPPDGEGLPLSGGVGMLRPRSPPLPPTLTSEGEQGSSPAKLSSPDAKRLRDSTAVRIGGRRRLDGRLLGGRWGTWLLSPAMRGRSPL